LFASLFSISSNVSKTLAIGVTATCLAGCASSATGRSATSGASREYLDSVAVTCGTVVGTPSPREANSSFPIVKFTGHAAPTVRLVQTPGPTWCGSKQLANGTATATGGTGNPQVKWLAQTWTGKILHNSWATGPDPYASTPLAVRGSLAPTKLRVGDRSEYVLAKGEYKTQTQTDPDPVIIVLEVVST
jgi:hypothetical protein